MKQKNKAGKVKKNSVVKSSAAKRSVPQKKTAQLKRTPTNPKKASGKKPPVKGKKPLVKKEVKKAIPVSPLKSNIKAPLVQLTKQPLPATASVPEPLKPKIIKRKAVVIPPPAPVQISNWPKSKVKNLLVSQPKPAEGEKNPYLELARKYNLTITFRQFIKVEGLSPMEFRAQRVEILSHSAVILTSKLAIDHFFRLCQELRLTVPETMKYYCINEQTAYYLQKYIQYRKRKISYGTGSLQNLLDLIRKNKNEFFLLPCSDAQNEQIAEYMDQMLLRYSKSVFYRTVSADLKDLKSIQEFDILVFFTPAGIKSLKQNFPQFKQQNTRIAAFGHSTGHMVNTLGYRLDVFAPNPKNPSMTGELDAYIKESNKR